jgi:excisionase family DNA binding protein
MKKAEKCEIIYYTYPEAAQLLRCSEKTLYNRVRNGDIKPLRHGRLVLFTKESLEELLKVSVPVKRMEQ